MERKVGLRSGQRPVGYHASREGLQDLRNAQSDASRARKSNRGTFKNRLHALADEPTDEEVVASDEEVTGEERVTFHPGGPTSRQLKPGERWRLKG